jgi:hypothetical protein
MSLLDGLLLAPVKAVAWVAGKIQEEVDKEFNDEKRIKEKLMAIQMSLEMGQISEEDYDRAEEELLARLDAATKAKEEGM